MGLELLKPFVDGGRTLSSLRFREAGVISVQKLLDPTGAVIVLRVVIPIVWFWMQEGRPGWMKLRIRWGIYRRLDGVTNDKMGSLDW